MALIDEALLAAAWRDAEVAQLRSRVEVRSLHTHDELAAARKVWDDAWPNPAGGTEVTSNHLRAIEHAGGYVGGAYDGGTMVGSCLGFLGRSGPRHDLHLHLHSHMAAVVPGAADRGIGAALKLHQRAWSLDEGIDRIVWTFDPLVRRNARLNLIKLGGVGVEYLVDFYGQMDDALNQGEPSDRIMLEWDLLSPRVGEALAGTTVARSRDEWVALGAEDVVLEQPDGPAVLPSTSPVRLVALPEDIVALRSSDPELARRWRLAVRDVVEPLLSGGGRIVSLTAEGSYVVEVGS
ncbi:MAG TPA: hypothetical protein VFL59_11315 [Candidatus Nanopelagicales bacterium]|nr:hypothetical protein [Candidatus Nanopelagicales bacterium]